MRAEWEPEGRGWDNPTTPGTRLHREDIHETTHQYTLNVGKSQRIPMAADTGRKTIGEETAGEPQRITTDNRTCSSQTEEAPASREVRDLT